MIGSINPVYNPDLTNQTKLSDISDEEFKTVWMEYKYNWKQRLFQAICFVIFLTPLRIVIGLLYTICYLLVADIGFVVGHLFHIDDDRIRKALLPFGQVVTRGTLYFCGLVWIQEKGHFHKNCRFIICNHTAITDPIVLLSRIPFSPIIKAECEDVWYFKYDFAVIDPIFVKRDRARGQTKLLLDRANDPSKNPVLVFPEGTIPGDDYMLKFHKSSFLTEHDVQPVVLTYHMPFVPQGLNTYRWKKVSIFQHFFLMACMPPSYVTIEWLDPINLKTTGEGDIDKFAERAELIMANKLGLLATTRSSNEIYRNLAELKQRLAEEEAQMKTNPENKAKTD